MTNRKHTKTALFASVISMLLCVTMLVGSTFAWFTDNATVSVNSIVAGKLEIAIVDANGKELTEALSFKDVDGSTSIKWEPNATFQTGQFYIQNKGNLYLTYKIEINNTEISYNKLNEVINFTLIDAEGKEYDLASELKLAPEAMSGALRIQGHMSQDADNSYQGLTLDGVAITVYAKQATEEKDMTGDQYDKDAAYDDEIVTVKTADEFIAAFAALEEDQVITLTADIDMAGKTWTPVNGKGFTLNGNGHTISNFSGPLVGTTGAAHNYTIKNITFKTITSNGVYGNLSNGGLIGYADTCAYINMADVTIDGATVSGAEYIGGFVGYTSGYGVDTNGPVNTSHNFTNCTIKNATLTSSIDGAVGGLIGHAGSNPATTTRINGFTASGNTLSNDNRDDKIGSMIGTANVGIVYVTDTDITADNIGEYIGRFVPAGTGKLYVNGTEIAAYDGK